MASYNCPYLFGNDPLIFFPKSVANLLLYIYLLGPVFIDELQINSVTVWRIILKKYFISLSSMLFHILGKAKEILSTRQVWWER